MCYQFLFLLEILLEPENRYVVISVDKSKPGFPGIIWITVEVKEQENGPVIEDLTKDFTRIKEGKQHHNNNFF